MTLKNDAFPPPQFLLFLKAPRPGGVKTRLARGIGEHRACQIYRAMVEGLLHSWPEDLNLEIHYAPTDAGGPMRKWLGERHPLIPQLDATLGQRLEHAVAGAFSRGAPRVLCIGGDCPALGPALLREAVARLDQGDDLVLGPCLDGGYYLIGMNAHHPQLFRDIPWSSSETLQATIAKAEALRLQIGLLETLYDVDTADDLARAVAEGRLP